MILAVWHFDGIIQLVKEKKKGEPMTMTFDDWLPVVNSPDNLKRYFTEIIGITDLSKIDEYVV